jgi:hypothetical protein
LGSELPFAAPCTKVGLGPFTTFIPESRLQLGAR